MKTLTLGLLVALLAAPLAAGEKETANTKAFLDAQTAPKEAALGKETLHLLILGISVGKMDLEFAKGEHDGKPAYLVTAKAAFEMGVKNELALKAALAPNLTLLWQEETETTDGKVQKSTTYKWHEGAIVVEISKPQAADEADRNKKHTIKPKSGLLLGVAPILLGRVLPAETRSYDFSTWDDDSAEAYPATVEVAVDKDGLVTITQTGTDASLDAEGNLETNPKVITATLKGGKFVKVDMGERFELVAGNPPKRTPITDEMLAKQDKELLAVALFFKAATDQNQEQMAKAVNVDRFLDIAFDKDPEARQMTPEQRAEAKAMYGPLVLKQFMGGGGEKSETDKKNEAAFFKLLMHTENFVVSKGEGEQMKVTLADEARKIMKLELTFVVEKFDNKWQIVWVDQGGNEEDK